jgi:hypothetical protein
MRLATRAAAIGSSGGQTCQRRETTRQKGLAGILLLPCTFVESENEQWQVNLSLAQSISTVVNEYFSKLPVCH